MANITVRTIGFDDMTEKLTVADSDKAIVFRDGEAHRVSLKTLRRRCKVCPTLVVTAPANTKVTISCRDMSYSGEGSDITFDVPEYGTWTITAELNGTTVTRTLEVDTIKIYRLTITF